MSEKYNWDEAIKSAAKHLEMPTNRVLRKLSRDRTSEQMSGLKETMPTGLELSNLIHDQQEGSMFMFAAAINDLLVSKNILNVNYSVDSYKPDDLDFWNPFSRQDTRIPKILQFGDDANIIDACGTDWSSNIPKDKKFDLVLGSFPFNLKGQYGEGDLIINSLSYLVESGIAIYIVIPSLINNKKFQDKLSSNGFYISAVLEATSFLKRTTLLPNFLIISKESSDNIFVAKLLHSNHASDLAEIFFYREKKDYWDEIEKPYPFSHTKENKNIYNGIFMPKNKFYNFDRLAATIQIEKLETSYKEYKQYSLQDLAIEINAVRQNGEFKESNNAIYIPTIGKSNVVNSISKLKLKNHNYLQVILNEKALNEYVSLFFSSDIGRLTLRSLVSGVTIKIINKREIGKAVIALPDINTQNQIVSTQNKINDLQYTIQEFSKQVALNPTSAVEIVDKLDDMLNVVGNLTEADRIRSLSRMPESINLEFKETLCWNVRQKQKDKDGVETSALKTIVGFLNSEGGTLLIGVSDKGEIKGINTEVEKIHKSSLDKFKLYLADTLKHRIGEEYYEFYKNYEAYDVDGKLVLKIDCTPYDKHPGVYLDGNKFYVRENPRTSLLEGRALAEYTKKHFA